MISTLQEFDEFLKICRKKGVVEVKFGAIEIKFDDSPKKSQSKAAHSEELITTDMPTDEELAYFHVDPGTI